MRGDAPDRTIREIDACLGAFSSSTVRLVMTESAHFANEGIAAALGELKFGEYKYIASSEEGTCEICESLDGKVFAFRDKAPGVNFPPIHPNCRCTVSPRVAGDFTGDRMGGPGEYGEWLEKNVKDDIIEDKGQRAGDSGKWDDVWESFASITGSFFGGVRDAAESSVEGVLTAVRHPIETVKAIINITPYDAAEALYNIISDEVINGDAESRARFFGRTVGEIALAVLTTKGIDKAAKGIKAAKGVAKAAEAVKPSLCVALCGL